jgi:hypothetical protein
MKEPRTEIGAVQYNPVDQCFDALVTFHFTDRQVRVAASYHAPINSQFEMINQGLKRCALKWLLDDDVTVNHQAMPRTLQAADLHSSQTQTHLIDWLQRVA